MASFRTGQLVRRGSHGGERGWGEEKGGQSGGMAEDKK